MACIDPLVRKRRPPQAWQRAWKAVLSPTCVYKGQYFCWMKMYKSLSNIFCCFRRSGHYRPSFQPSCFWWRGTELFFFYQGKSFFCVTMHPWTSHRIRYVHPLLMPAMAVFFLKRGRRDARWRVLFYKVTADATPPVPDRLPPNLVSPAPIC